MARIRGHVALNEDKPLYALRRMVVDGNTLEPGDPFEWHTMPGVTPRIIRLLHEQRKIGHNRPADPARGAEPPPGTREEKRALAAETEPKRVPATSQGPSGANGKPAARQAARA